MRQATALEGAEARRSQDESKRSEARFYESLAAVADRYPEVLLWIVDEICGVGKPLNVKVNAELQWGEGRRSVGCAIEARLAQYDNLREALPRARLARARDRTAAAPVAQETEHA